MPSSGGSSGRRTKSSKADFIFPVGRLVRFLRTQTNARRIGKTAPVYMAAVLQYLATEVLEVACAKAKESKKQRVTPRHINLTVADDTELKVIFNNVTIRGGGKVPGMHPFLKHSKYHRGQAKRTKPASSSKSPGGKGKGKRKATSNPSQSTTIKKKGKAEVSPSSGGKAKVKASAHASKRIGAKGRKPTTPSQTAQARSKQTFTRAKRHGKAVADPSSQTALVRSKQTFTRAKRHGKAVADPSPSPTTTSSSPAL